MTHKILLTSLAVISLGIGGCEQAGNAPAAGDNSAAAGDGQGAEDAVKQVESQMLAAFQAKDAPRLASYYGPDALLALPGRTVRGSDEVGKALAADLADPAFKLSFTNEDVEVAESGELAWTSGSYEASWTNPQTRQVESGQGTYVTVFRKQDDGSWKVAADVATPKAPAQQ